MIKFQSLLIACAIAALSASTASAQDIDDRGVATDQAGEIVDLSLEDAIMLARERSFRTARSQRNQDVTQLRYSSAKAGYLPRADIRANADQSARGFQYSSDQFDSREPTRGEFRSGLNGSISMPVDLFGVVKRQVGQADLQRNSSRFDLMQSLLDVTLEAQNNYLSALRAQSAVDADEDVVEQIKTLLERSRTGAPLAVPFLEVELGNAQQSLTSSRTTADQAQDGLRQTLRLPPETRLRLTTRMTDKTESFDRNALLQRALAARPDVNQAQNRVRQSEIAERQVADYRRPNVAVNGFYSDNISARTLWDSDRDRFRSHGAGINVNVPLAQYDGGQLGRQKQIAKLQTEQARSDSTEVQERVAYELRQALLAVQRAENRIRTLPNPAQALAALQRAEQSMLSAGDGQAQALLAQVSNARSAWRSAMTAANEAYIDYNNALFRLKRTIGEGELGQADQAPPKIAVVDVTAMLNSDVAGASR